MVSMVAITPIILVYKLFVLYLVIQTIYLNMLRQQLSANICISCYILCIYLDFLFH